MGLVRALATAVRRAFICPIRLYQRFVSPLLPSACRFRPTCSEYTAQAIERFGVVRGMLKGAWRIARCNPFGGSGYDPVCPDDCQSNAPSASEGKR